MALALGKKSEFATHRWVFYIRGPNFEDLSTFISKVVFSLHPSFVIPVREVTQPPFEVSESGWGEFEGSVRIFFKDPTLDPVDFTHKILLYPQPGQPPATVKRPVVSEKYDEIVFTEPTYDFKNLLMQYIPPAEPTNISELADYYTVFSEERDIENLTIVQDHLTRYISHIYNNFCFYIINIILIVFN